MELHILGSSSNGNCAVLQTAQCRVLIDAGFSGKRIAEMLADIGLSIKDIDAVFITHEHSDHIAGIRGLAQHEHIAFFANRDTANFIQQKQMRSIRWNTFATGSHFKFRDLEITSFSVPHDASDPVGFLFESGEDTLFSPRRTLAWCTDLGYVPRAVAESIRNADLLVIESNHDIDLLEQDSKRPWAVKQRIRGRHGHLSNQATFDLLTSTQSPRWRQIFLGHLSQDCNDVALLRKLFEPLLHKQKSFALDIIPPHDSLVSCNLYSW